MKKFIFIFFLNIFFNNVVFAANGVASFQCDSKDGSANDQSFKINLNNNSMEFGPYFDYRINKITDEKISAKTIRPDTDGTHQSLSFNRYNGNLTLIRWTNPPFIWDLNCRKLDKTKKIF
jgi:hypothetical protein